jgi:hypothetical protein
MNNQGNKAENVMQLIMDLEGRVRVITAERDEMMEGRNWAIHKYWLALTYKGAGFWWGYGVGTVSMFVVGLVIKWVVGK